jgi:hypothetical protein
MSAENPDREEKEKEENEKKESLIKIYPEID